MNNGGKFANKDLGELTNQFGTDIKYTAAYNPSANDLNELKQATIYLMLMKML